MALQRRILKDWLFALGDTEECLREGRPVCLPHTWSIEEKGQYTAGRGWYRTVLSAGDTSGGSRAFLHFHGAYRDTEVSVNGIVCTRHAGSGYTPFTVEITQALRAGEDNTVTVCVDNRFSTDALPYDRSFDWANDGGLYRPVELWTTGIAAICGAEITARPVILSYGMRSERGPAVFGFRVETDGAESGAEITWELLRGAEGSMTPAQDEPFACGIQPVQGRTAVTCEMLADTVYWHFDRPELYTLRAALVLDDGVLSDKREWVIGFREMKAEGEAWYLNGEPVRLPGMEWMPGSDPALGMAESTEDLERMLRILKESNSVLTRFHWQQDDAVYDWCDRHGLLVQEEVPFWGKKPENGVEGLLETACMQIDEMIAAHRHHPSIIAWGVGNELAAQTWPVQRYIRQAVSHARDRDSSRLVNYVTNTAFADPQQDGTGSGDILMINDYIGTWHAGFEQHSAWRSLLDAWPGRIFVPSEFGLCEPAFAGGDPRREAIFLEKTAFYRTIPQIAGTVYFCLNDYRTHMGEEGEGKERRRVHGSADLQGNPKPSYRCVQREYAPLLARRTPKGLLLTCRRDLPCYAVRGYILEQGDGRTVIPDLEPGETWLCQIPDAGSVRILRPDGDFVLEVE